MKFSEGIARANLALEAEAQDARANDDVCRIRLQAIADQIDVDGYEFEFSTAGGLHIQVWKAGSALRVPVWFTERYGYAYRRSGRNELVRTRDLGQVIEDLCYELEKRGVVTVQK